MTETHPLQYYTYKTLTSACWLLLPSRIFISMAYHIYLFFICSSTWDLFSFISYTPTHWFSLICVFYYICRVCVYVVRLCLLSIRFPFVMCTVYTIYMYGILVFNIRRKITCNFHLCWRLIAALLPIHNTFFFSFFVWFLFFSFFLSLFILFLGP